MSKKDQEDFNNSTKCWICKKAYEEDEVKVKDHNHITGKFRECKRQECKLNFIVSKNYDSKFAKL